MYRMICVLAVAAACVFVAGSSALSAEVLGGMETWHFQLDLKPTGTTVPGKYEARHSTSTGTLVWTPNKNIAIRLTGGLVTSNLDHVDGTTGARETSGSDGGLFVLGGLSLEQELDVGGALILDTSYSIGRLEWEDAGVTRKYEHDRTGFFVGYAFGTSERARPYVGIGYNTYEAELHDGPTVGKFEEDGRFSLVGGARAKSDTFAGSIELTLGGEFGLRLGLVFGF